MSRLHLPHPHIAEQFTEGFEDAMRTKLRRLLHLPLTTDDMTSRAARKRWAEYDLDRWMAEHGRKETKTDA